MGKLKRDDLKKLVKSKNNGCNNNSLKVKITFQ